MSDIADELRAFEGSEALANGDFSACYRGAAEITRLRAACDAYFKTISLSQMRHGRILVGLERRNARQRRALAKLYQRRHEKNATLANARREGMEGFGDLVASAYAEAIKAMRKFPQPNYVISKIAEEAGEVVKAAIHCAEKRETAENVAAEMKQLIAMLIRLWVEGDQVHRLPPIAAAIRAAAKEGKP